MKTCENVSDYKSDSAATKSDIVIKRNRKKKKLTKEILLNEIYDIMLTTKKYMIKQNEKTGEYELCEKKLTLYFKAIELGAKLLGENVEEAGKSPVRLILEGDISDYAK